MSSVVEVPQVRETEVVAKARRRGFTAEYKLKVLDEVDRAVAAGRSGEVGAILRREGLYSSHLAVWRRSREAGELSALAPKKRGPKTKMRDPRDERITALEKDKARIEARLRRAEALLDLQKKVSEILGIELPKPSGEEP